MHLDDRDWWRDGLAGFGIRVRTFSESPHLVDALRITCPGDPESYERLTHAVASLTVPQALLIDLKSVVVSDGPSRCEAIVDTAAEFAVKVTPQDVYTRLHDVDDDCLLLNELLKASGVEVFLDEIREQLSAVKNQTSHAPLLGRQESDLVDRQLFERLSGRIPMVIITDEPRREVGQWLRMRHLDQFFSALICKEDAPPAPSYEALRLGCEAIGAARAWWIAGSASAMGAARVVGLLPLGVLTPGSDTVAARAGFIEAGAARVLADLHEIERRLLFHTDGVVSQPGG
jgi:phosphoglycolate phosphatase-like HAD superfamily hydrolase